MQDSYNPNDIEDYYYQIWEERGYFEPRPTKEGKTFCIMMPPPNVTGSLHIGHALTFTLQDIIVRYKRMDGFETLWQPGLDHAGIATQNIVEKQLLAEGIKKEDIGKEAFLQKVWEWKAKSGGQITHQMRKLGVSPAWDRTRFTMDEGLKKAVKKAFVELYERGLVVRDNYMVNWCTHDGALSDIEVEHEDTQGKLYHISYHLKEGGKSVTIATTRPETFFGDTALMVHPDDERYKDLIGQEVLLPLIGKAIKIIADPHVDMEFGTGVVKVTPAHDPNDYEVGKRHDLEFVSIFDEQGILNEHAHHYQGQERLEARSKIVDELKAKGHMVKIEDHAHQVGHCYRCHNVVEPYVSKQWFVKKEIAQGSIEKIQEGLATFFPAHWINSYNAWMNDLRDWCISRQLWWGHSIPVFYCDGCGHEFASEEDHPTSCPKCGHASITQDPDVLDTWFSSGLWPFSTLGWGNGNGSDGLFRPEDVGKFYPNNLLITGFDILFFWVARMIMMGESLKGELPFKHIYLHALVRDEQGNKMSKSKGNVIDPLDMVEEFSADIVRFSLAYLTVQGRDIKLGKKHLMTYRNFTNKLFNAAKYLLMSGQTFQDLDQVSIQTPLGRYMQSRLHKATLEVRQALDTYRFNDAANTIYRFVWNEFCDQGIELSKADKTAVGELGAIFKATLCLVAPFMPFIAEHLYQALGGSSLEDSESIMVATYPKEGIQDLEIEATFDAINDAITAIRRIKITLDGAGVDTVYLRFFDAIDEGIAQVFVQKLAKVDRVHFVKEALPDSFSDVGEKVQVFVKSQDFDTAPIIAKLIKQQDKLTKEEQKLSKMLSNEKFVSNAPSEVIAKNREQLDELSKKLTHINAEIKKLS